MNSKIVFGVFFAIFSIFQIGYALKCYRCDSLTTCNSAPMVDCNQTYGNETSKFLDTYFTNVNTSLVSNSYYCLQQNLSLPATLSATVYYEGCAYSEVESCGLTLRQQYQQGKYNISCYNCNSRDGCTRGNDAGQITASMTAMALPLIIGFLFKQFV